MIEIKVEAAIVSPTRPAPDDFQGQLEEVGVIHVDDPWRAVNAVFTFPTPLVAVVPQGEWRPERVGRERVWLLRTLTCLVNPNPLRLYRLVLRLAGNHLNAGINVLLTPCPEYEFHISDASAHHYIAAHVRGARPYVSERP